MASFKDSNYETSRYVGGGLKRRFRLGGGDNPLNADLGAIGFVMTRPRYNDHEPFLGALPFASLSNDWGGVHLTYVPGIGGDTLPVWYLQFSLKLFQL